MERDPMGKMFCIGRLSETSLCKNPVSGIPKNLHIGKSQPMKRPPLRLFPHFFLCQKKRYITSNKSIHYTKKSSEWMLPSMPKIKLSVSTSRNFLSTHPKLQLFKIHICMYGIIIYIILCQLYFMASWWFYHEYFFE